MLTSNQLQLRVFRADTSAARHFRDRQKFGLGFGYGAETDLTYGFGPSPKCTGTNSVSAETLRRNAETAETAKLQV